MEEATPSPIIVIGGGLMGSATAWQLTQDGQEVILLEKQDTVYTHGSSYGEARIARSSNRGNDIWSYLHNRSVEEVKTLIDYLNSTEEGEPFKISAIYTTSPVTYVGRTRIYERLMASILRQHVDAEVAVTQSEGLEKFEVVLPDSVLIQREYNEYSGTINPKQLIAYLHEGIRRKGGQVRYRTEVTAVTYEQASDLYSIEIREGDGSASDQLTASQVISAAGPYTGPLLEEVAPYFDTLINPERVFLAFLQIDSTVYSQLSEADKEKLQSFYPVINSSAGTRMGSFFSMIEYYDEAGHPVIKIGGHFQRSPIEALDQVWKMPLQPEEIEWSLNGTAGYMELLQLPIAKEDIKVVGEYSCVYSLAGSEVPFVTPILGADQQADHDFIVLGGMSGVGAKGAMAYGRMASNLMMGTTETDSLYLETSAAMGFERLQRDLGIE